MKRQYFYDRQIRRYITQIVRLFSGFQTYYPKKDASTGTLVEAYRQIPCVWGDMSRLGATWLSENSENILSTAPMMVLSIVNITPSPENRHSPYHQEDTVFIKKQNNPNGNGYVNKPSSTYRVSQHMPVPYVLEVSLNILVTSTDQKLEILEQILSLFNPGFRMQSNSSPFDIGKYFEITLGTVEWSSRSTPQGTSVDMDIATLSFTITPIYLNVPSKIRRNTLIKRIYTNMTIEGDEEIDVTLDDIIKQDNVLLESIVVTPSDYSFKIDKDKASGSYYGTVIDPTGANALWQTVFDTYGRSEEDETWIRIRRTEDVDDDNYDIYATFSKTDDPEKIKLTFDTDSFKATDLVSIDKIINPNKKTPTEFGNAIGTRYLITTDIEDSEGPWGITAPASSIIEMTEDGWVVSFNPLEDNAEHYVINNASDDQYYYDGMMWSHYLVGTYSPHFWMFDVQSVGCAK